MLNNASWIAGNPSAGSKSRVNSTDSGVSFSRSSSVEKASRTLNRGLKTSRASFGSHRTTNSRSRARMSSSGNSCESSIGQLNHARHLAVPLNISRYPVVDRAVEDMPMLTSPGFVNDIRTTAERILRESRGESVAPQLASAVGMWRLILKNHY